MNSAHYFEPHYSLSFLISVNFYLPRDFKKSVSLLFLQLKHFVSPLETLCFIRRNKVFQKILQSGNYS
jgi:hypothetical protein